MRPHPRAKQLPGDDAKNRPDQAHPRPAKAVLKRLAGLTDVRIRARRGGKEGKGNNPARNLPLGDVVIRHAASRLLFKIPTYVEATAHVEKGEEDGEEVFL